MSPEKPFFRKGPIFAKKTLLSQIQKAEKEITLASDDPEAIRQIELRFDRWDRFNQQMLQMIVTSDDWLTEYVGQAQYWHRNNAPSSASEAWDYLKRDFEERLNILVSFVERLALYDEADASSEPLSAPKMAGNSNSFSAQKRLTGAIGPLNFLTIGVTDYPVERGFVPLSKSVKDATAVKEALLATPAIRTGEIQLALNNASRGDIIGALQELADGSYTSNRILVYFSGHGLRLSGHGNVYLVPRDAFSPDDPDALLSLETLVEILAGSECKRIIILLDACYSGPLLPGSKTSALKVSESHFQRCIKDAEGVAILSSSGADQRSYEGEASDDLSLFTKSLVRGLRGDREALDSESILTVDSLYSFLTSQVRFEGRQQAIFQNPGRDIRSTGEIVIGDFRMKTDQDPDSLGARIREFEIVDSYQELTRNVLKYLKKSSYSPEQLTYAANEKGGIGDYLDEFIPGIRTQLRRDLGFPAADIKFEERNTLEFPGGYLYFRFEASDHHRGEIQRTLNLKASWLEEPERLSAMLNTFDIEPDSIKFSLVVPLHPLEAVAGLEAAGWRAKSEEVEQVEAFLPGCEDQSLILSSRELELRFADIDEILTSDSHEIFNEILSAAYLTQSSPPPENRFDRIFEGLGDG